MSILAPTKERKYPVTKFIANFDHGEVIRGGKNFRRGKWHASLDDSFCDSRTNASLTIYLSIYFQKIDPPGGAATSTHKDSNRQDKTIQKWKAGEFEQYRFDLVQSAQEFWDGRFWLQTPRSYDKLNFPKGAPTHRCNLHCRFVLSCVDALKDADYSVAVVRVVDDQDFRSKSTLFSQKDLNSEQLIPNSTTKFWTHYHEIGHLIGLEHVNAHGKGIRSPNEDRAYGVTGHQKRSVMGKGSVRRPTHALPWRQAAADITMTNYHDWDVSMNEIHPERLHHR